MQNHLMNPTFADNESIDNPVLTTTESEQADLGAPEVGSVVADGPLSSVELARMAMDAASEKKATDIMALNVGPYLVLVDYFVLATGNTDRQCAAIVDAIEHKLAKEGGRKSHTREGDNRGTWILLDYGDVVVHVFQPQARDEYRLEKLWGEADKLRHVQDAVNS